MHDLCGQEFSLVRQRARKLAFARQDDPVSSGMSPFSHFERQLWSDRNVAEGSEGDRSQQACAIRESDGVSRFRK